VTAAGFGLMIAVGQIRVGTTLVAGENDRPMRKTQQQIDR
jgi:hypothetical protein